MKSQVYYSFKYMMLENNDNDGMSPFSPATEGC